MTNQYMNNLYRDLLSNSPQTITIDIPQTWNRSDFADRHETGSSCFRLENELLFGYERAGSEQ